jgi:hypothetical protein
MSDDKATENPDRTSKLIAGAPRQAGACASRVSPSQRLSQGRLVAELHAATATCPRKRWSEPVRVSVAGRMMASASWARRASPPCRTCSGTIQLYRAARRPAGGVLQRAVQAGGTRRHPRRRGHPVPHQDRRAVDQGRSAAPADQVAAAAAGEVPRPDRSGDCVTASATWISSSTRIRETFRTCARRSSTPFAPS